jgi:IMP cyclohydrolase
MYVGRFVAIGKTNGRLWAGYRVSSRSFPNRYAVKLDESTAAVMARDVKNLEKNPHISYNCIRVLPDAAVVANGSHTDPIVEKIAEGYPIRDALAISLLAMDYEKDAFNTPRIAAVIHKGQAFLGIVTKDGLNVSSFPLQEKSCLMVATYEKTVFTQLTVEGYNADDVAKKLYDLTFEKPICAAGAYQNGGKFQIGIYNGPQ